MRALGAEVRVVGEDFEATARASSAFASLSGAREVHPGRDRDLILGAATLFLEMFEQAGEPLDVLFVPVGVGSCLAGAVLAKRACGLPARLVGVQAAAAPAMALAIQGSNQTAYPPTPTIADGLAVGAPVTETLELLRGNVQEMVLVSEKELLKAMQLYASTLHQLAEGAGAAALAGAVRLRESLKGQRVGLVLSGGNVDMHTLRQIFQ